MCVCANTCTVYNFVSYVYILFKNSIYFKYFIKRWSDKLRANVENTTTSVNFFKKFKIFQFTCIFFQFL